MLYILIALGPLALLLVAPAFAHKHPPTHPNPRCRCGATADVVDHERPWRSWCAKCHLARLRRRGAIH